MSTGLWIGVALALLAGLGSFWFYYDGEVRRKR